jgi:nicotinate-nucleotide adenylyltransferase
MLRRVTGAVSRRVGILAGAFDPVHKGHISFALQACEAAGLSEVALVPEPLPRQRPVVTHVHHRTAMLKLAVKPYPQLSVLELPDKQFTVATSLPRLQTQYPDAQLFILIGSDVLKHMSVWPLIKNLLGQTGLVIAARGDSDEKSTHQLLARLPHQPRESHVLVSAAKWVSARDIRESLQSGVPADGMLTSTQKYAAKHWLYSGVSLNKS